MGMAERDRLAVATHVLLIVLASLALLWIARDLLIPLVLAIMLWSVVNALADRFQRPKPGGATLLPRWLALLLAVLFLGSLLVLTYQIMASQSTALVEAAPVYQARLTTLAGDLMTRFGIEELPTAEKLFGSLNLGSVLGYLGGSVGAVVSAFILVLIYTGFLFAEQRVMDEKLDALHDEREGSGRSRRVLERIAEQVQFYIWMKTLISLLTGGLSYVVLVMVGVDFAAVWALLIFLLNFIPTVGSIVGVLLPSLLSLVQFDTLTPFLVTAGGLSVVQFVVGNLVEPAVMGRTLNLSPLMILLSLTFWGMLWGIPGMFLSVPMMVILAIVCSQVDGLRWVAVVLSADGNIADAEPATDT